LAVITPQLGVAVAGAAVNAANADAMRSERVLILK
jgi:hypothetical protein